MDQLAEFEVTSNNLSRSLARQADDAFKATDTAILGLSERIAIDGTSPKALDRLHNLLVFRVKDLPQLQGLSIIDKDGARIVNSLPDKNEYANSKRREYFNFHKNNASLDAHIGEPVHAQSSGEWVIPFSRRLNDAQGDFMGVILATVRVSYFTDFYRTFDIGKDGAIALIMNNGVQITRWPLLRDSYGKDLSTGRLFHLAQENDSGSAMIKSIQDGIERLNGYRHLAHYPVFVTTALSKDEILAGWLRHSLIRGIITFAVIAGAILLGLRLISQIKMRIHAEEEAKNARDALQELNLTLEKLAQQDGLTGLANRRRFDEVIDQELPRAKQSAQSIAMILIDIDYFKKFNDLYGHIAGDECLRQVGKIIKQGEKRSGDLAARYGGEEFVVLLPDTDLAGALAVAQSIRTALHALKIEHAGNGKGIVTISVGIDVLKSVREEDSAISFIGAADEALYKAKASGRDQIQVHESDGPA